MIKQILSLPDNTSDPAVYILSGTAPPEFEIHRHALSLFGAISRNPESAEFELARRQLTTETYESEDWYAYIRRICCMYNLPDPQDILDNPPKKNAWKSTYDKHLKEYWTSRIVRLAVYSKKARFLNPHAYSIGKSHPIIRFASKHVKEIPKCNIKLQLIIGSYILQAQRARFNQFSVKPECLLCKQEPETRGHFLVSCPALQKHREPLLDKMKGILQEHSDAVTVTEISEDEFLCTALILDCTSELITRRAPLPKNIVSELEQISQRLVFTLHTTRKCMLALLAPDLCRKRGKTNPNTISFQQIPSADSAPAGGSTNHNLQSENPATTKRSSKQWRVRHLVAVLPWNQSIMAVWILLVLTGISSCLKNGTS